MGVLDLLYQAADDTVIILPTGATATIREMTGHEQRLLTNKTGAITGTAVNQVLAACTVSLNETNMRDLKPAEAEAVMAGMLSADRKCLLFHIRRISLGDDFNFKTKCPDCGMQGEWEVKLSEQDFPVKPFQFQFLDDGVTPNKKFHVWESKVKPGLKFRANFITGVEEIKASRNKAKLHGLSDLEMRGLQVWDEEKSMWLSIAPDRLGDKVITEIRDTMTQIEGDQDDKVMVICPNCGQEAEFNLLNQMDFMIPGVLS